MNQQGQSNEAERSQDFQPSERGYTENPRDTAANEQEAEVERRQGISGDGSRGSSVDEGTGGEGSLSINDAGDSDERPGLNKMNSQATGQTSILMTMTTDLASKQILSLCT